MQNRANESFVDSSSLLFTSMTVSITLCSSFVFLFGAKGSQRLTMKQRKEKRLRKCRTIHLEEEGLTDFKLAVIIDGEGNKIYY